METIQTDKAPKAIGPYSQAIKSNNLLYCSGQIAIDPTTNELVNGNIKTQTKRVLENLKAVLEAANSSLDKAVKVTVYLNNMDDFQKMNEIYATYFKNKPARATVAVKTLPKNALVEIDCIADQ